MVLPPATIPAGARYALYECKQRQSTGLNVRRCSGLEVHEPVSAALACMGEDAVKPWLRKHASKTWWGPAVTTAYAAACNAQ